MIKNVSGQMRGGSGRLWIGLIIAGISCLSYFGSKEFNPITGKSQHVGLSPQQEIAMGLQSRDEMQNAFGGLDPDRKGQAEVKRVGYKLVSQSKAKTTDWQFDFHLLADRKTINAFALPGGQIFITRALYDRLTNEEELAGVLGHEIVHVLARHSSQQIAKQQLTQGLTGAVVTASGDYDAGRLAGFVGQMVNMKYGRNDELQADQIGVQIMFEAGYNPNAMVDVMEILARSHEGGQPPEFFSTHPNPSNRIEHIRDAIRDIQQPPV